MGIHSSTPIHRPEAVQPLEVLEIGGIDMYKTLNFF